MAKVDTRELKKFQAQLQQIAAPKERQKFYEDCLKDLVARFLRKVIKRTPVRKKKVSTKLYARKMVAWRSISAANARVK